MIMVTNFLWALTNLEEEITVFMKNCIMKNTLIPKSYI